MPCTGSPACPFLGRRSALRVRLPRPTGWGTVPRYTYRRLAKLPSTADQLRRHTVLNLPGMLHGLSFEHTVMEPGAAVPISRSEEHTSELQSHSDLVCRLLLEQKKK